MDKLRIGVIGAGFYACLRHIPRLLATDDVEVTAVCRRDARALEMVADHFEVPRRYTDYREMLDDAPLDAVVVSSPHALHYEHARAALERGLHVLTDKPLAVHLADAEELRDLATRQGRTLLVAAGPPYEAEERYIGQRIAAGELGALHLVQYVGLQNVGGLFGRGSFPTIPFPLPATPTDFRAHPELGGGGYFQDVGSHDVAGILVTTGSRPVEVTASFDDPDLDLRPSVVLRLDKGTVAVMTEVADGFPGDPAYRSLRSSLYVGGRGSLSTDSRTGKLIFQAWDRPIEEVPPERLPPATSPAQNFVGVLRGREEPLFPLHTAVDTVRVVEAAYRSAREQRPVRLDQTL